MHMTGESTHKIWVKVSMNYDFFSFAPLNDTKHNQYKSKGNEKYIDKVTGQIPKVTDFIRRRGR